MAVDEKHLPYRILVEGDDDKHVILGLFKHYEFPVTDKQLEVKEKKGDGQLLKTLKTELKSSELERLGIVIDADVDLARRWAQLQTILVNFGYEDVPPAPEENGTVIQQDGLPIVGVWLMPDNKTAGMLEDFICCLVPPEDALWLRASECLQAIPDPKRFAPQHYSKAHVHTWLAWQKDPGTPMGHAIGKKYLDAAVSQAQQFIDWLNRLFVQSSEHPLG